MQFISELLDYFRELLTSEQISAVVELYTQRGSLDDEDDRWQEDDFDDRDDEPDEYEAYEFPAPDRRQGHAAGKRRPLRHPALTAAGLVAAFRRAAKKCWNEDPTSRDIFFMLAKAHDRQYSAGVRRASEWRRFVSAVECLKDLDVDGLTDAIRAALAEREQRGAERKLFYDWIVSWRTGGFLRLAESFCRRRVDGEAGRAVLAALREIAWPEKDSALRNTNRFRSFLDHPEVVVIFDYYRVLRRLEYILAQTAEEAARRFRQGMI